MSRVEQCPAGPQPRRRGPVARIPTRAELPTLTHLARRPAVDVELRDVGFSVRAGREERVILKSVNGHFRSGELTAILGPSGAGKSTLMGILAGHRTRGVSGSVLTNGAPRQPRLFHKLSAYIQQEDLLQPRLTVLEALRVAADLKLGRELTAPQRATAVEELVGCMSLKECCDTRTERLSGGQRKRLSVALELVNNPPVIFLDEPTTGLDVVTMKKCIMFLKTLARQGRTIVCTIHQPSSSLFRQFDNVLVLARGRCVYHGSPGHVVHFLEAVDLPCPTSHNPADFIMELLQLEEDHVTTLAERVQDGKSVEWQPDTGRPGVAAARRATTKLCREETLQTLPLVHDDSGSDKESWSAVDYPTTCFAQFAILLRRMSMQLRRNKTILWIQLLHHVLSAVLLGSIYLGTGDDMSKPFMNFKFSISVMVFFMYTHVMTPVLLFPTEVKLLKREHFNRWYSLKSYYMALSVASIPPMIVFGLVFLVLSYLLAGQPLEPARFLRFSAVCLLLGAVSESFGLCVGALFSVMNGSVVAPASFSPLLALSVYGMNHGTMHEPGMSALMGLSYLRYGLVGIAQSLYGHGRAPMSCHEGSEHYCHYKHPQQFLHDLNMDHQSTTTQAVALLGFLVLYRGLAYLALRYRLTSELPGRLLHCAHKLLRLQ